MTTGNGIHIEGRGGDKGGSTPSESPDSLHSTQIADIIDLIAEGECLGLVNGLKSVFLDGVPIENDDGTRNFSELQFSWTAGTPGQAALPGINGVESTIGVGTPVLQATPIVRSITGPTVDTVRITIGVPQLSDQDMESGDLRGSQFEWAIDVQSAGGGYVEKYRRTVSGKNMSLYTRSVNVALTGGAPYDIRVRRISADSSSSAVVNAFTWLSYTEVQTIKLRYPNSALARLRIGARQFSRVPVRSYDWWGTLMQVPVNYDPVSRTYDGVWDGTFKLAWSNNPAWVLYLIATHPRFGLGEYVDPAFNNKWALYKIGQYCDGLVSDGRGGTEPRFTCNTVFTVRAEAYKVLADLSAVFRGITYWGNGSVEYSQDAPQDPELLYTPANVENGVFSYQDTSEKAAHSVFIAYWNDLTQQGKRVPEVYAPDDLIARYGVREMAMDLIGCTSRGQAARMARWARHSEQAEGTLVSFRVGSDGQIAAPGKVFKIADPSEAGERLGGRIKSATNSTLVLDAPVELRAGEAYTITVISPVAGQPLETITEQRTITTASGVTTANLTVSPSFSQAPASETMWVIESNAVVATTWRCLSVKEVSGKNQFEITAVAHNPSKYDAIELGLALDEPPISRLKAVVGPPTSLALLETVYTDGTTNRSRLTASWLPSAPYLRHNVMWRRDTSWWQKLPTTEAQTVDIGPLDPGVYEVKVTSTNALGSTSLAVQGSITIAGGPSGIRAVRLKASAMTFKVAAGGASAAPASIDLQADIGGLSDEDVTWSITAGTATLTGAGLTRSLTYADMTTETITVSVIVVDRGQTFSDLLTIIKLLDGSPGDPGLPGDDGAPGDDGPPGTPATSAQLSLDIIALPADSTGAVTSYTGAFTSLVIWAGDTIDSTGWTYTRINSSGVDSTLAGATLTIDSMSGAVDSGYVDITATRAGSTSITKRVAIVKTKSGAQGVSGDTGDAGPRGSVQLAHETTGTTWSDAEANAALVAAGYSGPANLDVVTLYNTTAEFSEARVYSSGSWLAIAAYISGNLLVDGTVAAEKLNVDQLSAVSADLGTVTAGRLESDVVVAGSLEAATGTFIGKVSAGSVDVEKLAGKAVAFTTPGTYEFVTTEEFTTVSITAKGGAGGGGCGGRNTTTYGSGKRGGNGGAGGVYQVIYANVPVGTLFTIVVGSGGAGGSGFVGGGTTGVNGTSGTASSVSGGTISLTAFAGSFGTGGQNGAGSSGTAGAGGQGGGTGFNGATGGGGTGGTANKPGANGPAGSVVIEAYNPNGVVLRSDWETLMTHLNVRFTSYTWP